MSDIVISIDGMEVRAKEGMTILDAAHEAGIPIPTLCHHEKLESYGACRICTVEAELSGRIIYVAACVRPVERNFVIRTKSEKVNKIRRVLLEELLAHAPDSEDLSSLAKEYGADKDRFEKEASFCVLCGLCVRYCSEVKRKDAIGFVDRGARRAISFIPELAAKECWNCKECFPLCPTSALQAAYVLTEALAFPASDPQGRSASVSPA
jgi:NADH dehydrogenase/NADH:ubiquinone oxidoreductase subunit G